MFARVTKGDPRFPLYSQEDITLQMRVGATLTPGGTTQDTGLRPSTPLQRHHNNGADIRVATSIPRKSMTTRMAFCEHLGAEARLFMPYRLHPALRVSYDRVARPLKLMMTTPTSDTSVSTAARNLIDPAAFRLVYSDMYQLLN